MCGEGGESEWEKDLLISSECIINANPTMDFYILVWTQ